MEESEDIPDSYSDPSVLVPKIGQLFEDELDGHRFYNLYARFNGFGIRRSKSRTLTKTGVKTMQEFCCIRQVRIYMVLPVLSISITQFPC